MLIYLILYRIKGHSQSAIVHLMIASNALVYIFRKLWNISVRKYVSNTLLIRQRTVPDIRGNRLLRNAGPAGGWLYISRTPEKMSRSLPLRRAEMGWHLPLLRRAEMDRYLPLFRRAEMGWHLPLFRRAEMDRYLSLFRRAEMGWHLPLLWKLDGSRFLPSFRKPAGIFRRFGFWKSGISGEVRLVSTGGVLAGCDYRKILGGSL